MFSFPLRKLLERRFHLLPLLLHLFLYKCARAHLQYTSFSCLHNFPNLKNCLVLRLQSFVYSTLYSSIRKILKIIIELLIHKSLFVSMARPQLKLRTNKVVTKRKRKFYSVARLCTFPPLKGKDDDRYSIFLELRVNLYIRIWKREGI